MTLGFLRNGKEPRMEKHDILLISLLVLVFACAVEICL